VGKGRLSHVDREGRARMVDVSAKRSTVRRARAAARLRLRPATVALITAGGLPKGPALEAARLAGILAAKHTAELVPLCHPIAIDWADVRIELGAAEVRLEAEVKTRAPTGAEMEALVAVSVAALTLYDMVKAVDRAACITDVCVLEKAGGRSGAWRRTSGA
jgi:cyclic pyranopterin phosphate synthase